jgi:hypothetical protein
MLASKRERSRETTAIFLIAFKLLKESLNSGSLRGAMFDALENKKMLTPTRRGRERNEHNSEEGKSTKVKGKSEVENRFIFRAHNKPAKAKPRA